MYEFVIGAVVGVVSGFLTARILYRIPVVDPREVFGAREHLSGQFWTRGR